MKTTIAITTLLAVGLLGFTGAASATADISTICSNIENSIGKDVNVNKDIITYDTPSDPCSVSIATSGLGYCVRTNATCTPGNAWVAVWYKWGGNEVCVDTNLGNPLC